MKANPVLVSGAILFCMAYSGALLICLLTKARARLLGVLVMLFSMALGGLFMAKGFHLSDLAIREERRVEQEKFDKAHKEMKEALKKQAEQEDGLFFPSMTESEVSKAQVSTNGPKAAASE